MSNENTTEIETLTETIATVETKPAAEKKAPRVSIKLVTIEALATEMGLSPTPAKDGTPTKSFVHYGHKGGVEVHVARNEDVTKIFVKKASPEGAFLHYDEQARKDLGYGNVFAEVDFSMGYDLALEAVKNGLQAAKDAPAPVKVETKPKAEKPAKAAKASTETAPETSADASA